MVPPKSSTFTGFSIINHPFWGTHIFGNTHIGSLHCLFFVEKCCGRFSINRAADWCLLFERVLPFFNAPKRYSWIDRSTNWFKKNSNIVLLSIVLFFTITNCFSSLCTSGSTMVCFPWFLSTSASLCSQDWTISSIIKTFTTEYTRLTWLENSPELWFGIIHFIRTPPTSWCEFCLEFVGPRRPYLNL